MMEIENKLNVSQSDLQQRLIDNQIEFKETSKGVNIYFEGQLYKLRINKGMVHLVFSTPVFIRLIVGVVAGVWIVIFKFGVGWSGILPVSISLGLSAIIEFGYQSSQSKLEKLGSTLNIIVPKS